MGHLPSRRLLAVLGRLADNVVRRQLPAEDQVSERRASGKQPDYPSSVSTRIRAISVPEFQISPAAISPGTEASGMPTTSTVMSDVRRIRIARVSSLNQAVQRSRSK